MKVIVRGTRPEDVVKEVRCHSCDSVLQYTNNDVKGDQRDGDHIICPVCGAYIASHLGRVVTSHNNS